MKKKGKVFLPNFDFASLYPSTFKWDESGLKELKRQQLIKDRVEKLKKINEK